jgi:hypothetical protein
MYSTSSSAGVVSSLSFDDSSFFSDVAAMMAGFGK